MIRIIIALAASVALCGATLAQTPQLVRQCVGTSANCVPVSATSPLPITGGGGAAVVVGGATSNASSAVATSATNVQTVAYNYGFNGTTWDQWRSIVGAPAAGTGILGVAISPVSASAAGLTPSVSTAVESNRVLKASAGNLYSLDVTAGATSGYVLIFNATSAPADGAVTPLYCWPLGANQSLSRSWNSPPAVFSTGITAVFSTTGCFTKTASATAFISGASQ